MCAVDVPLQRHSMARRYTLDAATHFLLGRSVGSLGSADSQFAQAFGEVQRVQNLLARAGPFQPLLPRRSFREGLKVINTFIEPFIQDTLRLSPEQLNEKDSAFSDEPTFLHSLAKFTRDREGMSKHKCFLRQLMTAVIRDQLVNLLLAGRDTTAGTLSFLFKELSAHPSVYAKLRQEILSKLGLRKAPSYEDVKNMRYLQHCISETLRLYPSVPFNLRLALKHTTLPRGGGPDGQSPIGVLKDTCIGYSPLFLQRDPAQYPPESPSFPPVLEFAPERWDLWAPKPWQYIPFNGGPRICIGVSRLRLGKRKCLLILLAATIRPHGNGIYDNSNPSTIRAP